MAMSQTEILAKEVFLVQRLDVAASPTAENMSHLKAVCLLRVRRQRARGAPREGATLAPGGAGDDDAARRGLCRLLISIPPPFPLSLALTADAREH